LALFLIPLHKQEASLGFEKNTRALLISYKGQLIAERYSEGFTYKTPQHGW
jgi:hypothetical protein